MNEIPVEVGDDGRVVLRVPLGVWPVFSFTVVDRDSGAVLWHVLPDTFVPVEASNQSEVSFHSVTVKREASEAIGATETQVVTIVYGETPHHMMQRVPEETPPPRLLPAVRYLLAVRETWSSDLSRYSFRVG